MKHLLQITITLGFAYWAVSVYEFVVYRKTSGALPFATLLLITGFGGLFIYNKIKGKK